MLFSRHGCIGVGADRIKQSHTLSAAYGLRMLDLTARLGVPDGEVLAGFDLSRDDLAAPDRSLPIDVAVAMLERACALTGDPALGVYLGMQMQASAHGILGFAALTAGTIREAMRISVQYMAIRTTAVSLSTQVADDVAVLVSRSRRTSGARGKDTRSRS